MYDAQDYAATLAQYYDGQWSAFYAYMSTYTMDYGLIRETREAIAIAEKQGNWEDYDVLTAFLAFCVEYFDNQPDDDEDEG